MEVERETYITFFYHSRITIRITIILRSSFSALSPWEGVTASATFVSAITVHLYRLSVFFSFHIQISLCRANVV